MHLLNKKILFLAFVFGLSLGLMDAFFDWMYHYQEDDTYLLYLFTDFPVHEVYWRGSFLALALFFGFLVSFHYNRRKESESLLDGIFDNIIPICITNNDHDIIKANTIYYKIFGVPEQNGHTVKCYDHRPGPQCKTDECPLEVITKGGKDHYVCESTKKEEGKVDRTFIVNATPYFDNEGRKKGIIEYFLDITARRKLENEKEQLIEKLNSALTDVKKLTGFLPICATCKKVRDDKGYWKQIESYIAEHSDTEFSHSICPDCAAKYYAKLTE